MAVEVALASPDTDTEKDASPAPVQRLFTGSTTAKGKGKLTRGLRQKGAVRSVSSQRMKSATKKRQQRLRKGQRVPSHKFLTDRAFDESTTATEWPSSYIRTPDPRSPGEVCFPQIVGGKNIAPDKRDGPFVVPFDALVMDPITVGGDIVRSGDLTELRAGV